MGRGEVRSLGTLPQPETVITLLALLLRARDPTPERLPDGVRLQGYQEALAATDGEAEDEADQPTVGRPGELRCGGHGGEGFRLRAA